uniref:Uncharacterized protein n=1 Tax=Glossina morsitans morsitans TaxID=37546 RepID=A0A1B0FJL4_GLOMM
MLLVASNPSQFALFVNAAPFDKLELPSSSQSSLSLSTSSLSSVLDDDLWSTSLLPVENNLTNEELILRSLHKRQTTWHEIYAQTMQSQRLDWFNPCGGQYLNQRQVKKGRRPPLKKALRKLRNVTGREFKTLNITTPAIDMSDIRIWDLHQKNYGFLPKLKLNSSIALRRWHRYMQIYVASFAYLRRAQLHWDYHKTLQQSEVAKELNALKNSARNILCHLEIAINNTTTFNRIQNKLAILTFKRTTMEKKLKFQTPLKHISPALWKSNVAQQHYRNERTYEVNPLDLKFTKSHYFNFLRKMIKILRINTKRKDKIVWQARKS